MNRDDSHLGLGPDLRTKRGLLAVKAQVGARTQHADPQAKAKRRAKGKAAKAARRKAR